MTSRVEHKIRPILARQLGRAIDQPAHLRLDTEVECAPPGPSPLRNPHENYSFQTTIPLRNDIVITRVMWRTIHRAAAGFSPQACVSVLAAVSLVFREQRLDAFDRLPLGREQP